MHDRIKKPALIVRVCPDAARVGDTGAGAEGARSEALPPLRSEVALPDTCVGGKTHRGWTECFQRVPWDVAAVLTFRAIPPTAWKALDRGIAFGARLDDRLPFRPPYLLVVEGDRDDEIRTHIHVLLAGIAHVPGIRQLIRDAWPCGFASVDSFHDGSLQYVTKLLPSGVPWHTPNDFRSRVHGVNRFAARARKHEQLRSRAGSAGSSN